MAGDTTETYKRNIRNAFYSSKWYFWTMKKRLFDLFAIPEKMPRNNGKKVHFKFATPPTTGSPVPIVEGVTPPPLNLSRSEVIADLDQYGNWLQETDQMRDVMEDGNNLNDIQNRTLGTKMVEERDRAIFDIIKLGTNVRYANGSSRSAVNSIISIEDIDYISRTLDSGLNGRAGEHISEVNRSDDRFGTVSVEPAYVAICHPDMKSDLRNLPEFSTCADYGNTMAELPGEFGKCRDIRFLCTTNIETFADAGGTASTNNTKSTTGTSSDVYPVIFLAQDCYSVVNLEGEDAARLIRKTNGEGGTEDPLDQRGSVGYKHYFAAAILYQERMVRGEFAVTDL